MATLDIKFTKFDNRPWGFRLAGGSDFPEPLTVIRPISELTHGQAHEALVLAGNNFVLGVRRTEDPNKTVEGIEEKIEPYMLPLEEILFAPIEEKRETTPDEAPQIEDESVPVPEPEPNESVELYPEKARDENSEPLPNTDLTDEEIAQLILDEEEVLNEKGVLGVNFKKLRPRAPLLKESKVFQELQLEASSEPTQLQELKRRTTFLRKPERPVPKPRRLSRSEEPEVEPYRVLIKKQPRKSVTERLLERGLLVPSRANTPEVKPEILLVEIVIPSDRDDEMLPINEEQSPARFGPLLKVPKERKRQRLCRRGSIRETYDSEILHRGSSRRNSRRASSCRRESSAAAISSFESGILAFKAKKEAESLDSFGNRCAEGRRRLSLMSMMLADKVSSAMRTDIARGLAYAMVPCASALAFFMFNYAKRFAHPSQHPSPICTKQKTTPSATPEPRREVQGSEGGDSRPQSQAEVIEIVESTEEIKEQSQQPEPRVEEPEEEPAQVLIRRPSAALQDVEVEVAVTMDRDKIKELVTTEISLERQLESVQSQLMALKQLPSEIEKHLKIVSEQLHKIMELSGVEAQETAQAKGERSKIARKAEAEQLEEEEEVEEKEEEKSKHEDEEPDSIASQDESSSWAPHLISTEDTWTELKELEISVKSNEDDGKRVKKYIVTYESKVVQERSRSRSASPALSQKSFEPDPKLTLQDQLVQELKHRKGRKPARDLWQPQARQLELTYGRKWRCPNDFFNDEMIADVLSSQAEVIRGRALGVNFKKFEKTALPNYDHLMNSSVYKMIHKMEAEPKKGIPARPPKVIAAEDIIERVVS
ncbi:hypothetical protein TSAR_000124, partial [Trichomalopsis sarcophagae]